MIGILQLGDSFADVWPELVRAVGAGVRTGLGAAELLPLHELDAVVLSAGGTELEAVRALAEMPAEGRPPVAVAGSGADHRLVQLLLQGGAERYFDLPDDVGALRAWIADRVEAGERRRARAAEPAGGPLPHTFSAIVGASPAFREALDRARKVVPLGRMPVLITGETGTGKEVLARAIHQAGPRAGHPFVEVNCAALPAPLLESELFGHEKGAFTDARAMKPGLFELADGGTLFLDEIGDMPAELQAKLLKVLDSQRVRRVGGVRETEVDVRILAATHQDLAARVRSRHFREDLYYRLNVFRVHLPPLRERGRDVLLLARHFLERFGSEYGLPVPDLTPELESALLGQMWPGNVRELRNALERALALSGGALHPADLLPEADAPHRLGEASGLPFPASLEEINRAAARATLRHCQGNKSEAARILGITRKRLYALLHDGDTASFSR